MCNVVRVICLRYNVNIILKVYYIQTSYIPYLFEYCGIVVASQHQFSYKYKAR